MGEKIALGFHTCVDYELEWDAKIFEKLIEKYQIYNHEIFKDILIDSVRTLVIACLGCMKDGIGGEMVPEIPQVCEEFANNFKYKITIGGTATRAAISINKIGYKSVVHMCCINKHMKNLLPNGIEYFSSVEESEAIYPHVVLQYPKEQKIRVNDIDFVTKRANRIMFSRDEYSCNMKISQDFSPMITDARVFLLSCFSEILEFDVLKNCIDNTKRLLSTLKPDTWVILEDGCYVKKDFRYYVHEELKSIINVISMNEDELQDYVGKRIDILSPKEVAEAIEYVYSRINVPNIILHSCAWALAYGENNGLLKQSLEDGIALASTRFQWGDDFGLNEYKDILKLDVEKESAEFCNKISEIMGSKITYAVSKNLDFVKNPTIVGLGDFFAGGLLPALIKEK